ncbi:MAG: hypothetical protein HQL41_16815 [Alphaproteobacteria bacterium]|nr:hypothetical protein [Alphaproteobacteria bacterium]
MITVTAAAAAAEVVPTPFPRAAPIVVSLPGHVPDIQYEKLTSVSAELSSITRLPIRIKFRAKADDPADATAVGFLGIRATIPATKGIGQHLGGPPSVGQGG